MNVLGIHTRCRSIDELVAWLHPLADETSIFIATSKLVATGTESPFAILLADRRVAMQGWCIVFDAWSDARSPYGRPGIRLGLHRLTPESKLVIERVQSARIDSATRRRPVVTEVRRPFTVKIPSLARSGESRAVKRIASCAIPRVVLDAPTARVADPLAAMRSAGEWEADVASAAERCRAQTRVADPMMPAATGCERDAPLAPLLAEGRRARGVADPPAEDTADVLAARTDGCEREPDHAPPPSALLLAEGSRPTTQTEDVGYVIDIPPRELVQPGKLPSTPRRYWVPMCASTIACLIAWVTLLALGGL